MHEQTMPITKGNSHNTQPPPAGPPLPRRVSPENSITLRHHRLVRDASHTASPGSGPPAQSNSVSSPRRNSSGDSHETGQSDPMKWFDHSNENPGAALGHTAMDVDPPFFQKESDSSNEEKPYRYDQLALPAKLTVEQNSSTDDYRSVIDDLTVEIQRLKEELKRYKQPGPDTLRKDKLFEIKVHGLPKKKKRELEAKLRDFAAGLEGSPETNSSSQKKKHSSRHTPRDRMYSASGSMSKHASSSSGSHFRPADSAYASMSIGAHSSGQSLSHPGMASRAKVSEQKVESYLRDIPEGLYPRYMILTDKEKKKLVVRRLEQLFTGKMGGRHAQRGAQVSQPTNVPVPPIVSAPRSQPQATKFQLPGPQVEPSREARILPLEEQSGISGKKSRCADIGSASTSHEDQTDSSGIGNSSGSGANTSPPVPPPPEQRPTRIKDLDPDRVQVPSENMDYIRHLGLVPPELLANQQKESQYVRPDADGWVYLNLLCNLAQLHIMNVTPDFVRSAVSERSAKFQLSPDGRKIRWRGGSEGTKFSSDSSGYNSQKSPSTDDTDGPKRGSRKRQKTGRSTGESGSSGIQNASKFEHQVSNSSSSFHYKPLFVHHDSSGALTSLDETVSSFGPVEDSNLADSRWGLSGSGASNRKKRRHDGAIIYYSGVPFCTDLSGDPGDTSPAAHMASNTQGLQYARSPLQRTTSGSLINYNPLSDKGHWLRSSINMGVDGVDSSAALGDEDDDVSDIELDLTWSDKQQYLDYPLLETCGLGGVLPEDHFVVVVTTRRPKCDSARRCGPVQEVNIDDNTDAIIRRLASMSTSSPVLRGIRRRPRVHNSAPDIEIEYLTGRIKRLTPVGLPPPAMFFPPFSTDSSTSMNGSYESEADDDEISEEFESRESRKANPHRSDGYPDGVDLSSGDEEGDEVEDSPESSDIYMGGGSIPSNLVKNRKQRSSRRSSSAAAAAGTARSRSKSASASAEMAARGADRSSVATAGGAGSGYSSSDENSS